MAVVTTNLPMLSPVIQGSLTLFPAKFRSWVSGSSFRQWFSSGKHTSQSGEPGSVELQNASGGGKGEGQRVREPPSLYHITAMTESEERILGVAGQNQQQDVIREGDEASTRDLE